MFWLAPAIGVLSAVVAFVIANDEDYPPAQMTIAVQAIVVLVAWLARAALGRKVRVAHTAGSVK
jgi:hypothetical protein